MPQERRTACGPPSACVRCPFEATAGVQGKSGMFQLHNFAGAGLLAVDRINEPPTSALKSEDVRRLLSRGTEDSS
jgi:hypothetical protein